MLILFLHFDNFRLLFRTYGLDPLTFLVFRGFGHDDWLNAAAAMSLEVAEPNAERYQGFGVVE